MRKETRTDLNNLLFNEERSSWDKKLKYQYKKPSL